MKYEFFKKAAEKIAVSAGDDIILNGFLSDNKEISYKSRTNIVTKTDKLSEEFICSKLHEEFPEHRIIAEEGKNHESDSEFLWYVDPLDATNNFAHGIPHFCVSIGLFSLNLGETIAGAVYDPCRKELFSASKGTGAFCNNKKIYVSKIDDIGYSILATGFPYDKNNTKINNLKQFNAVMSGVQCVRRFGSAALDLCYVAAGRMEGYWEPMLKPWDVSAGCVIVTEAGGLVTDYRGGKIDPEIMEIVAGNKHIHKQILKIIMENTDHYPGDLFRDKNRKQ